MYLTFIIEYYNGRSFLRKLEIIFPKRKKFLEVFFSVIFLKSNYVTIIMYYFLSMTQ